MSQPILYLFIGFPGAGKTTTAKIISERSRAVHLWADAERHKMFGQPTHSEAESLQLYEHLNRQAAQLLASGKSVVFDTNFNHYADRQKLREIAGGQGAETIVIWLTTPEDVARSRAVCPPTIRNGYLVDMTDEQFDAIVSKLEPPHKNEKIIKIDGTKLDRDKVIKLLKL